MRRIGFPLVFMVILLSGCQPTSPQGETVQPAQPVFSGDFCGSPLFLDVSGDEGHSLGYLEVINDSLQLWVSFAPAQGAVLKEAALFVGKPPNLPVDMLGNPTPEDFPIQLEQFFFDQRWHVALDLEDLPLCMAISCRFGIVAAPWADDPAMEYKGTARLSRVRSSSFFEYCLRRCEEVSLCAEMDALSQQTQSPEAWVVQEERLSGMFPQFYPGGLELGCDEKRNFRDAEKVVEALRGDDRLLAEWLALQLTLDLGAREGAGPGLETMQVVRGAFAGWTVADLREESESILGSCVSNYSSGQMAEVLAEVNRNALPNQSVKGFLACPE